jgi:hypothetical protein
MANSIMKDRQGPDWPLGVIAVGTPGTPVNIMSLVDPTNLNAPQGAVPAASANNTGAPTGGNEYTERAQQIIFQAYKSNSGTGLTSNTGNIYIVRSGAGGGSGNRTDFGAIVACLSPGQTLILVGAPMNKDVFSPYRYRIDADNAGDSCLVTLIIQ